MDLGLANKVAFIAASGQGLGKAVAMELAREGARLIICDINAEALASAEKDIREVGGKQLLAIPGNLSKERDRAQMIATVMKHYDAVDILITNTGGPPPGKFEELKQEQWDEAYESLLASTVSLIRGFLPGMKNQPWGRIITMTSQAVKQPVENLILSNAVRASVVGLMKTLASELGPYNITVNNVMPGYTKTARLAKLIENDPSIQSVTDDIPLSRFGEPEEFAATVTFLASQRASYITGVSLAVDGGWIKNIL